MSQHVTSYDTPNRGSDEGFVNAYQVSRRGKRQKVRKKTMSASTISTDYNHALQNVRQHMNFSARYNAPALDHLLSDRGVPAGCPRRRRACPCSSCSSPGPACQNAATWEPNASPGYRGVSTARTAARGHINLPGGRGEATSMVTPGL